MKSNKESLQGSFFCKKQLTFFREYHIIIKVDMKEYIERHYDNGTIKRYLNNKLHAEGKPAVEDYTGTNYWYTNGGLHREDGPAVEYASGTKEWWSNGKLHRDGGPAIEFADGSTEWWINGKLQDITEFGSKPETEEELTLVEIGGVQYELRRVK